MPKERRQTRPTGRPEARGQLYRKARHGRACYGVSDVTHTLSRLGAGCSLTSRKRLSRK